LQTSCQCARAECTVAVTDELDLIRIFQAK
jgi:hypothetical protein